MMTAVPIVSWNIRGINDPFRPTMVSTAPWKHLPIICLLPETHLIPETLSCVNFAWVWWAYHATHTSYSRGVSIMMIYRSLDFQLFDKVTQKGDMCSYFADFSNWRAYLLRCLCMYIFNAAVLRVLLLYQLGNPDVPLILVGDLNGILDPVLDKHPPPLIGLRGIRPTLLKFIEEVGWIHPWHFHNPQQKQFCFSKNHSSLSRIDLCLCTPSASPLTADIQYLTRGISDHSPLLIQLNGKPTTTLPRAPWKLNAFWLNLFTSHDKITNELLDYWRRHADHLDMNSAWDAFKEFLRGLFITKVNAIKRNTNEQREQAAQLVRHLKA